MPFEYERNINLLQFLPMDRRLSLVQAALETQAKTWRREGNRILENDMKTPSGEIVTSDETLDFFRWANEMDALAFEIKTNGYLVLGEPPTQAIVEPPVSGVHWMTDEQRQQASTTGGHLLGEPLPVTMTLQDGGRYQVVEEDGAVFAPPVTARAAPKPKAAPKRPARPKKTTAQKSPKSAQVRRSGGK